MPRASLFITLLTSTLLISTLLSAPGCVMRTPAAPGRLAGAFDVQPLEASAWPSRVDSIALGHGEREPRPDHLTHLGPYGVGELYEFTDAAPDDRDVTSEHYRFMLFVSSAADEKAAAHKALRYTYYGRDSRPHSINLEPGENGTFVTLWAPLVDDARGLIIYLGGLGGTTWPERTLIHTLHRRGWAVIAATPPGDVFAKRAFGVRSNRPIDRVAAAIASRIDSSLAERAYAVTAAIEYLRAWLPDLALRPRSVIGGSIGAVSLPAVVATMRDEVDAAVLIGGGADFFRIIDDSPLGRDRIVLVWFDPGPRDGAGHPTWSPRAPTRAERRALGEKVLDGSRLDPFHTASILSGIPVLQVHGRYDAIVPAASGDLLYERLGRPERWSYPVGHFGLFFLLHSMADDIADWIAKTVARAPNERGRR